MTARSLHLPVGKYMLATVLWFGSAWCQGHICILWIAQEPACNGGKGNKLFLLLTSHEDLF